MLQTLRAPAAGPPPAAPPPDTYILLPRRLIEDLRQSPLAIAAYALIARLYLVSGEAVPLSPDDLRAFDPTISYGAGRRALSHLVTSGYASAGGRAGQKLTYHPTWGRVGGAPALWDRDAASLGRPRHIGAVRLDDRLLDLCLGRLRPHKAHRAIVERYLATPLLSLQGVGVYAQALAGLPARSPALARLGLLDPDGAPLPLPDDRTVLALASQRAAGGGSGAGLTAAGWQRAGFPLPPPAPESGQALFFVPKGVIGPMIGTLIGNLITKTDLAEGASSAPESEKKPLEKETARSHGLTEKTEKTDMPPPPDPPGTISPNGPGGGGISLSPEGTGQQSPPAHRSTLSATNPASEAIRPSWPAGSMPPSRSGTSDPAPAARFKAFRLDGAPPRSRPWTWQTDAGAQEQAEAERPLGDDRAGDTDPRLAGEAPRTHALPQRAEVAAERRAETERRRNAPAPRADSGAPRPAGEAPATPPKTEASPRERTETERLLQAIGVRADVAARLSARQPRQVAKIIADARSRSGIRDIPAWVVSALRALPETPPDQAGLETLRPLSAYPIHIHPGLTPDERSRWILRFRAAESPLEQREILARLEKEHPRPEPATSAGSQS